MADSPVWPDEVVERIVAQTGATPGKVRAILTALGSEVVPKADCAKAQAAAVELAQKLVATEARVESLRAAAEDVVRSAPGQAIDDPEWDRALSRLVSALAGEGDSGPCKERPRESSAMRAMERAAEKLGVDMYGGDSGPETAD